MVDTMFCFQCEQTIGGKVIKDIRLGPTLPAFITPNILQVLIDKFAIKPILTPDEDLKSILG